MELATVIKDILGFGSSGKIPKQPQEKPAGRLIDNRALDEIARLYERISTFPNARFVDASHFQACQAVREYITGVAYTLAEHDGRKHVTVGDVQKAIGGIAYN